MKLKVCAEEPICKTSLLKHLMEIAGIDEPEL